MTWLGPPRGAGPAWCPAPSIPTRSSSSDNPWHMHWVVQRHQGRLEQSDFCGTEGKAASVGYHAALRSAVSFTSTEGNIFSSILATGLLISHPTISECSNTMGQQDTLVHCHDSIHWPHTHPGPCPPRAEVVREQRMGPVPHFLRDGGVTCQMFFSPALL